MFNDLIGSVKRPFTKEMPLSSLLLFIALFLILAWVAYDGLRILSSWVASAAQQ